MICIYAIIDSNDGIGESICGLEKANVYNSPYRDIGVVVSDLNERAQGLTKDSSFGGLRRMDNVLAHEKVVERLMKNFTVLPVRFRTIFDGKETVLSMMEDYYSDFKDNLNRLRNKVEFGIKVIWPGDKIKEHLIKTHRFILRSSSLRRQNYGGEGTTENGGDDQKIPAPDDSLRKRFMKEKFEKYKIDRKFREKASKCINAMDVFFSKFAAQKKLEKLRTENLLLSAVYLVERDKQNDFREAFEHIRTARDDFRYLFSGPWPPYNFVILPGKEDGKKEYQPQISQINTD